MALSDSMFLVEIIVEELRSYVKCKEFVIKSQFADIFSIILKDQNELERILPKLPTKKPGKRKANVRGKPRPIIRALPEPKVKTGQSILIANNVENLITNMRTYPIELSLWSKIYPDYKIASTQIPWSSSCIEYLSKLYLKKEPEPVSVQGEYNVFHEFTSRRMAVIKLNIKLSHLTDKMSSQFTSPSEENLDTFAYTTLNSEPPTMLSAIQERTYNLAEETGIIKTIYSGNRKFKKSSRNKQKSAKAPDVQIEEKTEEKVEEVTIEPKASENKLAPSNSINKMEVTPDFKNVHNSIVSLVKSEVDIDKNKTVDLIKSKSCSSLNQEHLNILNYIFGDNTGPFGNQVYCVSYFTVENDLENTPKTSENPDSGKTSEIPVSGKTSENGETHLRLKKCDNECANASRLSFLSFDLPQEVEDATTLIKCKRVDCKHKKYRELPTPPDERTLIDLTSLKRDCCDQTEHETVEKVEGVVGGMTAKMKFGEDPCSCECECRFGFVKTTTYCKICGGYEKEGEEFADLRAFELPFPCPIYHKLTDRPKTKPSLTGSDTKKTSKKAAADKSIESEKESKKGKKKKKEDKFKFNYGYTAPKIGHSHCAMPCTGTLGAVPKNMGWLWTAEDVPGIKFRPNWKPGATNKHVVRLLKMAKDPGEVLAKKKRKKDAGRGKRPLKRPLLVVHKKDGEYTVTMETMKTYAKSRAINQVPFEDKPALTYTIGRTDEENLLRRKKKERARRRLERDQRDFIQSAFRDMCQEICLKTYQQALGILPTTEIPDCTCYPAEPGPDRTDLDHSCSCSEDDLSGSDTDSDEWIVEFTPPTATFDPTYKVKKINFNDNGTQYTYLDYRVKLLDRYGNPVPRFFKGPDGKEQCSDLGGFWSPDKKWLEINVDGYIAPDGRWAPNNFIGPSGENVDGETGKFQTMDGIWLVVGIDGYIDCQGRWRYYPRSKATPDPKRRAVAVGGKAKDKKETPVKVKKSEATWSCFGDVSPKYLSEMGIMGHGHDRKVLLDTLNKLIAQGQNVKIPMPSSVPRSNRKKGKMKSQSVIRDLMDKRKCRHAVPSDKGVSVDTQGNKTYFRSKHYRNKRPKQRIATLTDQGRSLSSFHMPCFRSFTNAELMKKQQYDRLVALAKQHGQGQDQRRRFLRTPETRRYRNAI